MSESGPELAAPWNRVEVVNAAETDVPAMQPVLTLSANNGHSDMWVNQPSLI